MLNKKQKSKGLNSLVYTVSAMGMGLFKKKEEKKVDYSYHHFQDFFNKLKEETGLLTQWLHYFYKKNDEHDIRLRLLENHAHKKVKDDYVKFGDLQKQHSLLLADMNKMQRRVNVILEAQEPMLKKLEIVEKKFEKDGIDVAPLHNYIQELHKRLSLLEQKPHKIEKKEVHEPVAISIKETIVKKVAKKVAKNSKEYVQQIMLELIQKYGKISGLQLREMLVDEQKLCTRSTFYRLLGELEESEKIGSVREIKEKIYFSQIEKTVMNR